MTLAGTNSITLPNVYVGEVWILSGQSNFEFGLAATNGGKEATAASDNPMLRLFDVPHTEAETPQETVPGKWVASSPKVTKGFSAAGYWFGSKPAEKTRSSRGNYSLGLGGHHDRGVGSAKTFWIAISRRTQARILKN